MPTATRSFRVFVSSTFEDLNGERYARAAAGGPFEELTKVCQRFGARFHTLELRRGVHEEPGHDQQTMEICLSEIDRCDRTELEPNSVILLGGSLGYLPSVFRHAR